MRYDFWGTGYYPQRMTLSGGGNDYYGKILDRLGADLTRNLEFCKMNFEPYALFLNGEYWGFYYLTEKYDEHYIEHYYDVDSDNVVIIKNGKLEVGTEGDHDDYEHMISFLENVDMTDDSNYQMACAMLDMQSFIDYFAAEVYMARRVDWPSSNYALWRSRETSEKAYEDGKWRWMLFDVNTSAFIDDIVDHNTLDYVLEESAMFANLYRNEEFKELFSKRILKMADTIFEPSLVEQKVTEYEELMSEPMEAAENGLKNLKGHRSVGGMRASIYNAMPYEGVEALVSFMKEFAKNRKKYIEAIIEEDAAILETMWSN